MTSKDAWNRSLFEHLFKVSSLEARIRIRIKVKEGSGTASKWQAVSGSAAKGKTGSRSATLGKTTIYMPCVTGTTRVRQAAMPPSRQQRAEVRRDPFSSPGPPTCTAVPPQGLTAPTQHQAASPLTIQVSVPCSWSSVQVILLVRLIRILSEEKRNFQRNVSWKWLSFPFVTFYYSFADPDTGSGICCLFDHLDPGSWMCKKSGSGIRDEQPGSYFLELRNHFWGSGMGKNSDPGSRMEKSRIREPGSGKTSRIRNTAFIGSNYSKQCTYWVDSIFVSQPALNFACWLFIRKILPDCLRPTPAATLAYPVVSVCFLHSFCDALKSNFKFNNFIFTFICCTILGVVTYSIPKTTL